MIVILYNNAVIVDAFTDSRSLLRSRQKVTSGINFVGPDLKRTNLS